MSGFRSTLADAVQRFCDALGYKRDLVGSIMGPHDRYDWVGNPDEPQLPNADEPGCYVFVNNVGKVLYVGKGCKLQPSGNRDMGQRIWDAWRKAGEAHEPFPDARAWIKPGVSVWSVAVPRDHWFLAGALECFLISELRPSENKVTC